MPLLHLNGLTGARCIGVGAKLVESSAQVCADSARDVTLLLEVLRSRDLLGEECAFVQPNSFLGDLRLRFDLMLKLSLRVLVI